MTLTYRASSFFARQSPLLGMSLTSESDCLEPERSGTVQRETSNELTVLEIYTLYPNTWKTPTQTTNSKHRERRTISDLVSRTLPLAGTWCCYSMTSPNSSAFNAGDELRIAAPVCWEWELPGRVSHAPGTEQEGRGTWRSLFHLVSPNWRWALHRCCARFMHQLNKAKTSNGIHVSTE